MRIHRYFGSASVLMVLCAQAASLNVVGGWSEMIGPKDLVRGAGTDIRSPIESAFSQTTISITGTNGIPWALSVRRLGASLPSGVALAVRGTGSAGCSIAGGLDYLIVSDQDQTLITGSGDCNGIGIQLMLDGVSVRLTPGFYGSTLLYSLSQ
jgi:hypothetical protein